MDVKEVTCYKCGKCGLVYHVREWAERCCKPKKCERCGTEIPHKAFYTLCDKCREEKRKEEEQRKFDKAQKYTIKDVPPERCEMMYSDVYGYNEGYFSEIEELEDYCYDNDVEMPDYVWCTSSDQISIDAVSLVENQCEDLHEDALSWIGDKDIQELQTFVDDWCAKQTGTRTFYVDRTAVIILKDHINESENKRREEN